MDRKGPDPSGRWPRSAGIIEPLRGPAPAGARPATRPDPVTGQRPAAGSGWDRSRPAGVIELPRPAVSPPPPRPAPPAARRLTAGPAARQAVLLLGYLAAGLAVTWPRALYLAGHLPKLRDAGGYVWDFWWVARQLSHLGNPWFTDHMAAPLGSWLGYHTLMPLPAALLTPVTLAFGPSAAYNLLSVLCPGLLCYAMYRAARLWLPASGAVAAGAFFGLSTILTWRSWYEVNLAAGALFFPLALEAVVRLRRRPGRKRAVILGLVLGGVLLTDQESAVMTVLLTALALLPWLGLPRLRWPALPRLAWPAAGWARAHGWPARPPRRGAGWRPWLTRLGLAAGAGGVAAAVAFPQLIAMAQQGPSGGAASSAQVVAADYVGSGASLLQLFAPSPRVASFGLTGLAAPYEHGGPANLVMVGYGTVVSLLAVLGLAVAWRRRSARLLALLWGACSLLALGTAPWIAGRRIVIFPQVWHGVRVSALMPFTWLVQLPGLANFREADRFTELGLVGAALLAGAAVAWLAAHARPVLAVALVLGVLEAGWAGNPAGPVHIGVMPAALPALDGPIAADRSSSVVVDVPFGIRGGLPVLGGAFPPMAMVLATADGHPRGDAFVSRIPERVRARIRAIPFYAALLEAQGGPIANTPADLRAAVRSARRLHIGWVVDWERNPIVGSYLYETGFRLAYRAGGASVYRPRAGRPGPAGWWRPPHWYRHGLFSLRPLLPQPGRPPRDRPAAPHQPTPPWNG
ncbi:MAG: hypothetical protein ACM32E_11885 [Gemmatimonadota bacterium]